MKTKVLHVIGNLERGGVQALLLNVLKHIDREKYQFDIVVHHKEPDDCLEAFKSFECNIFVCPSFKFINKCEYKKWWDSFLKDHSDYDFIHSHVTSCASYYLKIAKKYGITTISHIHSISYGKGLLGFIKKTLSKSVKKYADIKLGCSTEANLFLYGKELVENGSCQVIKNGIDLENCKFDPKARNQLRKKYNIPESTLVVGTIGRIIQSKNPYFIVDLIKELNNKQNDFVFIWVGFGPLKESVKNKIKSLGLDKRVIFIESGNVKDYLSMMDIFIFPSISEGLGIALVEAQTNGLTCFASNTISKEAIVTPLVKQLSIQNNLTEWTKDILNCGHNQNRDDYLGCIRESGYDIKDSVKVLTNIYKKEK